MSPWAFLAQTQGQPFPEESRVLSRGLVPSRHPAWVRGVLAAGVTLFPGGFLAFAVNRPWNFFQEKRNHDFTLIFLIQILYFFNFYIHISLSLY